MKRIPYGAIVALSLAAQCLQAQPVGQATQGASTDQDALYRAVAALDTEFFGAFNSCDAPGQLQRHASFLDPNVEFYHDKGGVSWTRKDYVETTRRNVCGNYRRKLTPGSLEVYPIKGFGAIEEGHQTFCDINPKSALGKQNS